MYFQSFETFDYLVCARWWEAVLHSRRRRVSNGFHSVHAMLPESSISTSILYTVWLMHRRKDLWGPDGMCNVF